MYLVKFWNQSVPNRTKHRSLKGCPVSDLDIYRHDWPRQSARTCYIFRMFFSGCWKLWPKRSHPEICNFQVSSSCSLIYYWSILTHRNSIFPQHHLEGLMKDSSQVLLHIDKQYSHQTAESNSCSEKIYVKIAVLSCSSTFLGGWNSYLSAELVFQDSKGWMLYLMAS